MGAAQNGKVSDVPVKAEVIFVEGGTQATDFSADVKGKVVLLTRESSTPNYRLQVGHAVNAGAVGVILQSVVGSRGNYGSAFNPSLTKTYDVPVYGAAYIQGEWLKEQLNDGPVEIGLTAKHYVNPQMETSSERKKRKTKRGRQRSIANVTYR